MTTQIFLFAVIALLITPGPTNTLLALGGAAAVPRAALRLLPAELAGYLAAAIPLTALRLWVDPAAGPAGLVLHGLAAAWVGWLALRIGLGAGAAGTPRPVTARTVLMTTLLNPKVLVFGLILLPPPGDAAYALHLALFALSVPAIGLGWTLLGAALHRGGGAQATLWLRRGAALWLGVLAVMLAQGAIAA